MAAMSLDSGIKRSGDPGVSVPCVWTQEVSGKYTDVYNQYLLKLELPLLGNGNENFGTLYLIKDLKRDAISNYTLRRVELLRRSVIGTLEKLNTPRNA
jgi:UDP-GlcNAc:undecaprenyl-phosphate GlcNAc-1-phosphate transferase